MKNVKNRKNRQIVIKRSDSKRERAASNVHRCESGVRRTEGKKKKKRWKKKGGVQRDRKRKKERKEKKERKKEIVDKAASNENSSDFPSVFQPDEGRDLTTENEEMSSPPSLSLPSSCLSFNHHVSPLIPGI